MSVTRGDFLKQLGKSLPGMVLGSGVAVAAQKVLGKVAAASGAMDGPAAPVAPAAKAAEEIPFIKHGPLERNQIALTFDDGPTPGVTELILDELKRRDAKATFFMIGKHIVAAPDLARRVLAEGHEIGNHTYTHPKLTTLPDADVDMEIQRTQDAIDAHLHYRSAWFRPPYGLLRQNQAHVLQAKGLGIVMWNVDPGDWAQPGEAKITGTILSETKAGSIIVCHDSHRQTANSLPAILDGLLEKGLTPVTLSKLFA
jgi:peptidoglycan/xylan/chitin deacetylase (PgdA/CDA1 family)